MKNLFKFLSPVIAFSLVLVSCRNDNENDNGNVVTPEIPVASVALSHTSATLVANAEEGALTLTATISPADATDQTLVWTSSNPAVATVENGVVTLTPEAEGGGVANITVTVGGQTASTGIAVVQTQRGCNTADPTWGTEGLGTITWGSMDNTDIETGTTTIPGTDERADQIWSAGVFAAACRDREEFEGGSEQGNVFASCRRANTEITGHFFSWCAIVRFADVLCPYPWRVPTTYDFSELDMNLGGTGNRRAGPGAANIIDGLNPVQQIAQWYLGATGTGATPEIGGIWQGARFTGTAVVPNANWSVYWSQSEGPNDQGIHFILNPGGPPMQAGVIDSGMLGAKFQGFVVRCVRN